MTSLHLAVLCRFARINQVMDNIALLAEDIQSVQGLNRQITPFIGASVIVGKGAMIVCLNSLYPVRKQ